MKLFVTALGLASALALPLQAGNLAPAAAEPRVSVPAAAPAPMARNWTGGYAGARLGWGDIGRQVSGDGLIGGLHAGYLQDFGGFALGIEGGADATDIDVTGVGDLEHVLRLGVRGGVTAGDIFAYGVVGAARARVSTLGSDNGWYGGIGLEYALDDNWRLGGELLHHRFDDFTGVADVSATTLQARLSFRF